MRRRGLPSKLPSKRPRHPQRRARPRQDQPRRRRDPPCLQRPRPGLARSRRRRASVAARATRRCRPDGRSRFVRTAARTWRRSTVRPVDQSSRSAGSSARSADARRTPT